MDSECILWYGAVNSNGYGPHRQAFEDYYGPVAPGMDIMHECDNKRCINPLHLKEGTHSQNQRDARDRGLTTIKLDGIKVAAIREKYRKGEKQIDLAKEYNVTRQLIHQIVHNKIWL